MSPEQQAQKDHARAQSFKNGEGHGFLEAAKHAWNQQIDVDKEYQKGEKGPATQQAEKEGKVYHPFTGITY